MLRSMKEYRERYGQSGSTLLLVDGPLSAPPPPAVQPIPEPALTAAELEHFANMRARLAPALQAIVDIESVQRALTRKEKAALDLMLDGFSDKEIADRMGVTVKTAKHHTHAILGKFGVSSRAKVSALLFRRTV